jgi:hypothetical protein
MFLPVKFAPFSVSNSWTISHGLLKKVHLSFTATFNKVSRIFHNLSIVPFFWLAVNRPNSTICSITFGLVCVIDSSVYGDVVGTVLMHNKVFS